MTKLEQLNESLRLARKEVCKETFGTDAWESAMQVVRDLCAKVTDESDLHKQPFCSIDSGIHPTRLLNGRIINKRLTP